MGSYTPKNLLGTRNPLRPQKVPPILRCISVQGGPLEIVLHEEAPTSYCNSFCLGVVSTAQNEKTAALKLKQSGKSRVDNVFRQGQAATLSTLANRCLVSEASNPLENPLNR